MKPTDEEVEVEIQEETDAIEVAHREHIMRHADKNDHYREQVSAWDTNEPEAPPELSHSTPKNMDTESESVGSLSQEDFAPSNIPKTLSKESGEKENNEGGVVSEEEIVLVEVTQAKEVEMASGVQTHMMSQMDMVPLHSAEPVAASAAGTEASASGVTLYHTISGGPETLHDVISHEQALLLPTPIPEYTQNHNQPGPSLSGYTIPNQEYITLTGRNVIEENNFFIGFSLFVMAILGGGVTYVFFFMPEIFEQALKAVVIIKDQLLK